MPPESLTARNLTIGRNGMVIIDGASIAVAGGDIVGVIGANGSGKSTLLKALSGLLPYKGEVFLGAHRLTGRSPHEIVQAGVVHLSQDRRVFPSLTVAENLTVATPRQDRCGVSEQLDPFEYFPELTPLLKQRAGELSGGQQQIVSLARTLRLRPRFLLADEPTVGLSPMLWHRLKVVLCDLANTGVGILLVEHRTRLLELATSSFELKIGGLHVVRVTENQPGS